MRVQEHESTLQRGPNSVGQGRQIQDLRGGQGVQGCLGVKARMRGEGGPGGPGVSRGPGSPDVLGSNIQDFVQEVPVGQIAQGTPFRCLPWPTPPAISRS